MSCDFSKSVTAPIGVFDSGVGGLSVLYELRRQMPNENYIYFSDRKNAPYGKRADEEIKCLTLKAVNRLIELGCKAVVIACNTATAVAVDFIRANHALPIVGLEPALKPAVEAYPSGRVLLLATPVTLRLDKFKNLLKEYGCGNVSCISAPELVTFVERGEADTPCAVAYLKKLFADYLETRFDACVLGCTHFPFARNAIVKALGYQPQFFDGSLGAAKRLKQELELKCLSNCSKENGAVLFNENVFDLFKTNYNLL